MIKRLFLALLLCVALVGGVAPAWAASHDMPAHPAVAATEHAATGHGDHATASAIADDCAAGVGGHPRHAGMTGPAPACAGAASCGMMLAGWPVNLPAAVAAYAMQVQLRPGAGRLLRANAPSPDLRPPRAAS